MVPLSVLGQVRHAMVEQLDRAAGRGPTWTVVPGSALARLRNAVFQDSIAEENGSPTAEGGCATGVATGAQLHVLCRSMEQIERVVGHGIRSVIVDFADVDRCGEAVERIRRAGVQVVLATPRIQKPGEAAVFRTLAEHHPDGLLVRNLGGLGFCRAEGIVAVADFPLNAANELAVHWLRRQGASRVTAAADLDWGQVLDLAAAVPPEWLEVVVYQHTPMFHTEHCLYSAVLSSDADRAACGRPCRRRDLRLRDRDGRGASGGGRIWLPQHGLLGVAAGAAGLGRPAGGSRGAAHPRRVAPADRTGRSRANCRAIPPGAGGPDQLTQACQPVTLADI